VERRIDRWHVEPWQFWRTVPDTGFRRWTLRAEPAPFEDVGRSVILSVGFWALGGVSPYLGIWLGILLSLPLLLWVACELRVAGWPASGPALILLCAASPFMVESLTLPHSAVAFYLLTLIALVGFAAWATGGHAPSPRGLWMRLSLMSFIFAIGTIARAGSLLLLPAFAVVLFWARRQHLVGARRERPWRAIAGVGLLVGLFLLPYAVLRPAHHHNVWVSLWEGLGDFGSDHGYSWYDVDAKRALQEAGMEPFKDPRLVAEQHESFFRSAILRDVKAHPLWYAGVLARRVAATTGLTYLLPYGPRDGQSLGVPRFHYKYTTPADWLSVAGARLELRVEAMWLALLGIVGWWCLTRRWGTEAAGTRATRSLALVGVTLFACLPLPVLVSTASGIETQASIVAYFLSVGLLLDQAWASTKRIRHPRASTPARA
jgi:hypothetical protein